MPRKKTPTFKQFWEAYPVHKEQMDAERAWKRLRVKDKLAAMEGIAAYRDECLRTGVTICYGQKYLNHRRWTDEPSTPGGGTKIAQGGTGVVRGKARGGTGGGTPTPPPAPDEMEIW